MRKPHGTSTMGAAYEPIPTSSSAAAAAASYQSIDDNMADTSFATASPREKSTCSGVWKGAVVALAVGQMVIILLLLHVVMRTGISGGAPSTATETAFSSASSIPSNAAAAITARIVTTAPTDDAIARERAKVNAAELPSLSATLAVVVPHKMVVDHITPRVDQAERGTCWDFATIGMLEQSYRAQGVANGWLDPDLYVGFSEQAYGVTVLEQCRSHPSVCLVPGDAIWMNSTEGGEIPLLYYLPELNSSIVPEAQCPYIPTMGSDTICPGLSSALKTNPLKFTIKSMETLYELNSIKNHLRTHKRALGISTVMTDISYFYPCTGVHKNAPECRADPCPHPCPYDKFPAGTCCVRRLAEPYNLEGEFYTHGKTDYKDGGHAMLLVGYNDNYVTETGDVGGFILKNNWAGGSHSVQYFMQEISRWDESRICPNSINPRNWYDCKSIENCLSPKTQLYADVSYMPLRLKCVHPVLCQVNDHVTYFVKNASHAGDEMVEMCVFSHNDRSGHHAETCLGPYPLDSFAAIFRPIKILPDDTDRCGFYFFPYRLLNTWWATYHDGFATDFDTTWDPQSYAYNKDKYPDLDYSLVERSTKEQNRYIFTGPFPHDMTTNRIAPERLPRPAPPSAAELAAAGMSHTDFVKFTDGPHPRTTSALYRVMREGREHRAVGASTVANGPAPSMATLNRRQQRDAAPAPARARSATDPLLERLPQLPI